MFTAFYIVVLFTRLVSSKTIQLTEIPAVHRRLYAYLLDRRHSRGSASARRIDIQGAFQAVYTPHSHRLVYIVNRLVDDVRFQSLLTRRLTPSPECLHREARQ